MFNLLYPFVQSKKILRIIAISEKYNKRPSEVLGIENTHLAFCFDEAVEFILSHRYYREVKENNTKYKKMCWTKLPKWNDEEVTENNDFFASMEKNLEKQKRLRGIE